MSDRPLSISRALQQNGVKVGDVVELVRSPGALSEAISTAIGDEPATEGLLIEVTALGEEGILCYWLGGSPKTDIMSNKYDAFDWIRERSETMCFGTYSFRKVGCRTSEGIVIDFPNDENVYQRCQRISQS